MSKWRDSLQRIPLIGFFLVEIRGAGPCRGGVYSFKVALDGVLFEGYGYGAHGVCLGDGQTGRGSTVVRWTRRRAAPAYARIPDVIWVKWRTIL